MDTELWPENTIFYNIHILNKFQLLIEKNNKQSQNQKIKYDYVICTQNS